jgi:hypothetical protein
LVNVNLFGLLVIGHVVEWLFKALDVYLKRLEHLVCLGAGAVQFLVKLDSLLIEEELERRLRNLRVVCLSIGSKSSLHICLIVVGASCISLRKGALDSLHQRGIVMSIKKNNRFWEDLRTDDIAVP